MTTEATMRATVLQYFDCLNAEDWDRMRTIWHEDGTLRAVGARSRDDREALIGYFSNLFTPWLEHEDRPTRLVVSERDGTVLAEVTFTGITPGGTTVVFDAVDVFDFVDGRIKKLTNWYDLDYVRKALAPS